MSTNISVHSVSSREKQIERLRSSQLRDQSKINNLCNQTVAGREVPPQTTAPHSTLLLRTLLSIAIVLTVIAIDSGKIEIAEISSKEIFELISTDYSISMKNWLRENIYYRPIK